jgi:hypothetical protein
LFSPVSPHTPPSTSNLFTPLARITLVTLSHPNQLDSSPASAGASG